jgi:hypothetical protein
VLSENELLAEQGQRVHTGQSEPINRQFAEQFTAHFAELAAKYPVYGELRNIFDLAMAVALIQTNGLAEQVAWDAALLSVNDRLRLPQAPAPRKVQTVINHRVINRRHIVAGVSGGVIVAPGDLLKDPRSVTADDKLTNSKRTPPGDDAAVGVWWWDAAE